MVILLQLEPLEALVVVAALKLALLGLEAQAHQIKAMLVQLLK
jgi:hypothetical protein